MAPAHRGDLTHGLPIDHQGLPSPQVWIGLGRQHPHQLDVRSGRPLIAQSLLSLERWRFVGRQGRKHAGIQGRLARPQLCPPGTPRALRAQGIECVVARIAQAQRRASGVQSLVNVAGHLHGYIKLKTQTTHITHARHTHPRMAEVDLTRAAQGQGLPGHIVWADPGHQLGRHRPHEGQNAVHGCDVGQVDPTVRRHVAANPIHVPRDLGRTGDQQENIRCQAQHGQITFMTTLIIQHGRVHHLPHRLVHIAHTQVL